MKKLLIAASVAMFTQSSSLDPAVPASAKAELKTGKSSMLSTSSQTLSSFSLGENLQVQSIPGAFGPFKAKSTQIGVYKARLKVSAEDLKGDLLFLVIRMQEDKTHGFGWVRAYVNNQLVATEAERREARIVGEASKAMRPGEAQITIMGAAYPGTSIDYYVVPKESVLAVLQNKPLGSMLVTAGPYQAEGKGQEKFNDSFTLTEDESKSRMALSIKTVANKTARFGWIRVSLNGQLIASEQNFSEGEATVDLTGKLLKGKNTVEVIGTASPGTPLGWYLMQLPTVTKVASRGEAGPNSPAITKLSPEKELIAGSTIEISGRNFDADADNNKVLLDDQVLPAKLVSKDTISFVVPENVVGGSANLSVLVNDEPAEPVQVSLVGTPHVASTSVSECPAGYDLIINGDNFPESTDKLKVSFGGKEGSVLASCKRSILVRVPEQENGKPELGVALPVVVSVGKLNSSEKVDVKLGTNTIKSTAGEQQLIPQLGSDKNSTFNESKWKKLLEQAAAADKENRKEAAEYFYLAAVREASKSTQVSETLLNSLSQLSQFCKRQNKNDDANQYETMARELGGSKRDQAH